MAFSRQFPASVGLFVALVLFPLLVGVSGCQKSAGSLRQDCYPNETCNTGLVCVNGTCVSEGPTATPTAATPPAAAASIRAPRCEAFVACYAQCDIVDEDNIMPCRHRCDLRFQPFGGEQGCIRTHNPSTHPCDAFDECQSLCIARCPDGSCNSAMDCESDCVDTYNATCARARL